MIRTVTGGKYLGSLIKKADANVKLILGALSSINNPETHAKITGLQNLAPFVKKMEGLNGMVEQFKSLQMFATEDSAYSDAPTYDESFDQWFYTRKGWKLRDLEFSLALIEDSYEKNVDIKAIVVERLEAVYDWYINRYLPNVMYQTVLRIPSASQAASYYAAPVGLLRNTPVDKTMLKPGKKRTLRNNYKAIASASAGITNKDLVFFIKYFTEMKDVGEGNIVIYATRITISDLVTVLADPGNKDIFNRTGKPSTVIQGIQFVEDDRIPPGKMLMIDGSARDVIAHVVSTKKDLQGFSMTKDIGEGFTKFERLSDFTGAYWRVCPEGRFIRQRHKMMWIDLEHDAIDGDEQNMSDEGIEELREYDKLYEQEWRRSVS